MVRRLRALVLVVAAALGATGCSSHQSPAVVQTPAAVGYAQLVPARMQVVRVRFCDLVSRSAVSRALAGTPSTSGRWDNGAAIPGVTGADIGHELGCSWTGPGGAVARAWVFARPVTAAFAGSVVASAAHVPGCTVKANPVFGKPALTQVCSTPARSVRVRQAGLFGDTWLSCEVQASGQSVAVLTRRSDDWCAAVASALNTAG